jgi:pimeloyl-ACP methyl ester carboxylesterase
LKAALRRLLWATLVAAGALVLAAAAGWMWDRSEERAFWALDSEPPGAWIEVEGQRLHVVASGSGSPGVLFIAGGDDGQESFADVRDSIAAVTVAVSYDPAGLKWSPSGARDATVDQAVRHVGDLLSKAGLFDGPVILVGHSYGGTIARVAAERYPELVAGVVLVDAAEAYAIPEEGRRALSRVLFRQAVASSVGLVRWRFYRENPELTREQRLVEARFGGRSGRGARYNYRRLREALVDGPPPNRAGTLGAMPLTVLAATAQVRSEFPEQERMAALSTKGRLLTAETGHYIHWEAPGVVVAEIRRMIQEVRADP